MRDAIAAGVVVLVLLGALVVDVLVEYMRGMEQRDDDRARHSSLMREVRRHG
jgi:hypothetical protein